MLLLVTLLMLLLKSRYLIVCELRNSSSAHMLCKYKRYGKHYILRMYTYIHIVLLDILLVVDCVVDYVTIDYLLLIYNLQVYVLHMYVMQGSNTSSCMGRALLLFYSSQHLIAVILLPGSVRSSRRTNSAV
jgi:hypothetical protein